MLRYNYTPCGYDAVELAIAYVESKKLAFQTPETLLVGMINSDPCEKALQKIENGEEAFNQVCDALESFISKYVPRLRKNQSVNNTEALIDLVQEALEIRPISGPSEFSLPLLFLAIDRLKDDKVYATAILHSMFEVIDKHEFMRNLCNECSKFCRSETNETVCFDDYKFGKKLRTSKLWSPLSIPYCLDYVKDMLDGDDFDDDDEVAEDDKLGDESMNHIFDDDDFPFGEPSSKNANDESWKDFVEELKSTKPIIGREDEVARMMQILSRRDKHNILLVGEPGVGKTSVVKALVKALNSCDFPNARINSRTVLQVNVAAMLAGTQYRGMFEERMRNVLQNCADENQYILFFDEIHQLVGAGAGSENPMDAAGLLLPYLDKENVFVIGCTTYKEHNRYLSKNQALLRRFQQVDISEPSVEEAIKILMGLKKTYEKYHSVKYDKNVIEYAVQSSAKYLNERRLPDKAVDLIDEAGAYCEVHGNYLGKNVVTKDVITNILTKMCKVDKLPEDVNSTSSIGLRDLFERVNTKIYGQDMAVRAVTEAVQMSQAGLLDDNKPIASLLFVGPTGVGKTEVAKVLAKELGVQLIRFDMSEYAEKHTIAKLIGSPAGYVGYEDGGLLTDAIRKTPNCVLLLDEIEKAHSDIYNILLQVMDYASLSDNKGQKADFRHVVLIMTSNAGAQHAHKASLGFSSSVTAGDAMMKSVKQTFKPEFLNRLTATVTFNDMDRTMAQLILNKKLGELYAKLNARKVTLTISEAANDKLLQLGFTRDMGAREIDRVISSNLKTILMREILYGKLNNGGEAKADLDANGNIVLVEVKKVRSREKVVS